MADFRRPGGFEGGRAPFDRKSPSTASPLDTSPPAGGAHFPLPADGGSTARRDSNGMLIDLSVTWNAKVLLPGSRDEDVNVVVRVTYNTLEGICTDRFVLTASAGSRELAAIGA